MYLAGHLSKVILIPAYVFLVVASLITVVFSTLLPDALIFLCILPAIALPFFIASLLDRGQEWTLIPAKVMLVTGLMLVLTESKALLEFSLPPYVLAADRLPVLVIFRLIRKPLSAYSWGNPDGIRIPPYFS